MKKIFWFFTGTLLIIIGKLLKKSHIQFLGYYLQSTGKTRSLPVYTLPLLQNELNYLKTNVYKPFTFNDSMLFHTVGKVWAKRDMNITYIKDIYKFYPICEDPESHFSDCTCENKEYASVDVNIIKLPSALRHKFMLNDKYTQKKLVIGKHITTHFSFFGITATINDEFWTNKGKEFNVYSEIPREIPLKSF